MQSKYLNSITPNLIGQKGNVLSSLTKRNQICFLLNHFQNNVECVCYYRTQITLRNISIAQSKFIDCLVTRKLS